MLCYNILGHAICKRSSDEEAHGGCERAPLYGQYKSDSKEKGTNLIHNSIDNAMHF